MGIIRSTGKVMWAAMKAASSGAKKAGKAIDKKADKVVGMLNQIEESNKRGLTNKDE